jgi:hypothetical protein
MNNKFIWRPLGIISFVPLVLIGIALMRMQVPLQPFVIAAIIVSLLTSIIFCVIGFKAGIQWMTIWVISFVLLIPFSNILFWLVHKDNELLLA